VVKPPRQGSTVGVVIVKNESELDGAIKEAGKYDRKLLVEKFVSGRELTIGILGDQALPIIEIIPKGGFYDFNTKYPFLNPQAGASAEHVCPAKIDAGKTKKVQELALQAFRALGLVVYGRADVLLSDKGEPFVLEVNTIPGMTETSLLPEAAAVAGINYVDLCLRIIELSRARRERATRLSGSSVHAHAINASPASANGGSNICSTSKCARAKRSSIATANSWLSSRNSRW
jgi:D-alanine-D-alanine ligase